MEAAQDAELAGRGALMTARERGARGQAEAAAQSRGSRMLSALRSGGLAVGAAESWDWPPWAEVGARTVAKALRRRLPWLEAAAGLPAEGATLLRPRAAPTERRPQQ